MPLDIAQAPQAAAQASLAAGPVDTLAVAAAVERFLASRGVAVKSAAAAPAAGGPACSCETAAPAPKPEITRSVVAAIAAEVVDKFLARNGKSGSGEGYS